MEDKEYLQLKDLVKDFMEENGKRAVLWEFSKFVRLIYRKTVKYDENLCENALTLLRNKDYYKGLTKVFRFC